MKFKDVSRTDWFNEIEQKYWKSKNTICPFCGRKLYKRYEGMVCRNFRCLLYFKLEKGWVYLDGKKKNNSTYFRDKYDFNINRFENQKRWLILKSQLFYERERKCEICDSEISLHIHHILYRSEYPELTFDKENLMILCGKCHKKIHEKDKWRFS